LVGLVGLVELVGLGLGLRLGNLWNINP